MIYYKWIATAISFSTIAFAASFQETRNALDLSIFGVDTSESGVTSNASLIAPQTQIEALGGWDEEETLEILAHCESGGRQFDENGKLIHGEQVYSDIGKWQINFLIHNGKALELGLDLTTAEGNEAYARFLLKTEGLRPWKNSFYCLKKNFDINGENYKVNCK